MSDVIDLAIYISPSQIWYISKKVPYIKIVRTCSGYKTMIPLYYSKNNNELKGRFI